VEPIRMKAIAPLAVGWCLLTTSACHGNYDWQPANTTHITSAESSGWGEEVEATSDFDNSDLPGDDPPECVGVVIPNLVPVDIVGDAQRSVFYSAAPSDAPAYANELVVIDPVLGDVVASVLLGDDPGILAISDDASTLWVSLDDSNELAEVNLETTPPSVVELYPLPTISGNLTRVKSMVPLPGEASSVAISLNPENSSFGDVVVVLDAGITRPLQIETDEPARLTGGPPGFLFGSTDWFEFTLYVIEVTSDGLVASEYPNFISEENHVVFSEGRLYASTGEVFDASEPESPTPVGEFLFSGLPLPQPERDRVLMLPRWPDRILRQLDPSTFTQTGSAILTGIGTNDLDFATNGQMLAIMDEEQLVVFADPFE
jgi:hypothetical protein